MNTYTLFWRDGKSEIVKSETLSDAFTKAGYGRGVIGALDFCDFKDSRDMYVWDAAERRWNSRDHIPMTRFMEMYGNRLVKIDNDNPEYGDYRLIETEQDVVHQHIKEGKIPATIWEAGDDEEEESVKFGFEDSYNHPMVTGYFVLLPNPM